MHYHLSLFIKAHGAKITIDNINPSLVLDGNISTILLNTVALIVYQKML